MNNDGGRASEKFRSPNPWYWKAIGLEQAIQLAENRGERVLVGIVDTGTNQSHPELQGRFHRGYNLVEEGRFTDVFDDDGHGTAVASVVCGNTRGILPKAKYVSVRVANKDIRRAVEKDEQALITKFGAQLGQAILLCKQSNCDIINLSVGTWAHDETLENAVHSAYQSGILIVGTAGNFYTGAFFPGALGKEVIAVGGIEKLEDKKRGTSYIQYDRTNVWPTVDIFAPATDIIVADNEYGYRTHDGTSFATPITTGVLGLAIGYLKQQNRFVDPDKLQELLYESARDLAINQRTIRAHMRAYDPTGELFHDEKVMKKWMTGHGVLSADDLLRRIRS